MKTAIVTGAYGAIGFAIAEGIAAKGFRVTLAGRDPAKLEEAKHTLENRDRTHEFSTAVVDLSRKEEIIAFSNRWKGELNILVNNAATGPRRRMETPEGIEVQFATNVLGYFWMMTFFSPFLKGMEDARIVNVASYWAGGMNLADLEFTRRRYDNDAAYRQSKQADRMLTAAFASRLKNDRISVNACHPGDVNSKLSNFFGFGGHESPAQGAATPLMLALSERIKGVTGKYFEHQQEEPCPFIRDKAGNEELFRICSSY
jgi:NAD(P)-dependent dehydrogenase (short-subunit alcohol dehydrogenase family)